jgi:hypothetical protein
MKWKQWGFCTIAMALSVVILTRGALADSSLGVAGGLGSFRLKGTSQGQSEQLTSQSFGNLLDVSWYLVWDDLESYVNYGLRTLRLDGSSVPLQNTSTSQSLISIGIGKHLSESWLLMGEVNMNNYLLIDSGSIQTVTWPSAGFSLGLRLIQFGDRKKSLSIDTRGQLHAIMPTTGGSKVGVGNVQYEGAARVTYERLKWALELKAFYLVQSITYSSSVSTLSDLGATLGIRLKMGEITKSTEPHFMDTPTGAIFLGF